VANLHMLAPGNPIEAVDGSSDGNLDLCVTIVDIDRFGRGQGNTNTFHFQVTIDANAITNLRISGVLTQPAVCAG